MVGIVKIQADMRRWELERKIAEYRRNEQAELEAGHPTAAAEWAARAEACEGGLSNTHFFYDTLSRMVKP